MTGFSYAETLKFGGSTYDGEVKKDKAHGEGIFTFADGSKYEGQFRKNKMQGERVSSMLKVGQLLPSFSCFKGNNRQQEEDDSEDSAKDRYNSFDRFRTDVSISNLEPCLNMCTHDETVSKRS